MDARTAALSGRGARQSGRSWLRAMVAALDERVRLRHGIFEYTCNPDCLFRVQFVTASKAFVLSDGVAVRPGDRLAALHVWNEQFPAFPANGPTLNWGRRASRSFDASLRELAYFFKTRRDLDDVVAICGNMAFGSPECSAQFIRFVGRFGFEPPVGGLLAPEAATALRFCPRAGGIELICARCGSGGDLSDAVTWA